MKKKQAKPKKPNKPLKVHRGNSEHPVARVGCHPRAHLAHHLLYQESQYWRDRRRGEWGRHQNCGQEPRGTAAALTFLVSPEPCVNSSWAVSVWEVGWKKLIHEGLKGRTKPRLANRALWWSTTPDICLQAGTLPTTSQKLL